MQRLKGIQKVKMSEHISAIFQRKLPPKCGDPGMFIVPCIIGELTSPKAMLDLGASINVIPYSLYKSLKLGTLHETSVVIQLANRFNAYPKGIVEDVLVKVGDLIFPVDFYDLDMEHDKHAAPILLGRPFMKTAKTKIDVDIGSLTMEFDGSKVEFNIYDSMKIPPEDHFCFAIDLVDTSSQDMFDIDGQDKLKVAIEHDLNENNEEYVLSAELQEVLQDLKKQEQLPLLPSHLEPLPLTTPKEILLPSVLQAPKVELKPLPEHLKYVFLGENETLPLIISSKLTREQENKLVEVLKQHKEAMGWSIADIKGISPTTCMHRILLENDAKPVRQPQRRLNPPMMELVKAEILKLLQVGIIYPISDNEWVSPTQVVPKKIGVTVVKNQHGELVPTRIQNRWRVCIDYRRLNAVTRKNHFPLPFIDQMLERLASYAFYCFLNGY